MQVDLEIEGTAVAGLPRFQQAVFQGRRLRQLAIGLGALAATGLVLAVFAGLFAPQSLWAALLVNQSAGLLVLIAGLQLFLIAGVMRPLESRFPAERWSDRRLTTVDRNYTLRMLLGHDVRPSPVHQRTHAPRGRERLLGGCRQRARLGGCIR